MESSSSFKSVKVKANFFGLKFGQPIIRYKLNLMEDENPVDINTNLELYLQIISIHRKELNSTFGITHFRSSNIIYSPKIVDELNFSDTINSKLFRLSVNPDGVLDVAESEEAVKFYGKIIKILQGRLKFKQINRKYYDDRSAKKIQYKNSQIELWPGFSTAFHIYNKVPLINIDVSYRVLQEKTVADLLNNTRGHWRMNPTKLNDMVRGMTIVTRHSRMAIRLDGFSFDKKLTDPITRPDGSQISFLDYFKERYDRNLKEREMPLLMATRRRNGKSEVNYFPPELCVPTGLSEEMREDRGFMKELAFATKPNPGARLDKSAELIRTIQKNEQASAILKDWDINLDSNPLEILSKKAAAGKMVFGKDKKGSNVEISIENKSQADIDRDSQTELFEPINLNDWAIFYPKREERILEKFTDVMKQVVQTYNYPCNPPNCVGLNRSDATSWINEIEQKTNENTVMVVLILEGRKNAAPLYDEIKRFFITNRPIPNQVVLTSTINSDKGLRSICNKILVQMCAKMGGIPWTIDNLPLNDKPTMIIGIDVFHKISSQKKSFMAFTATINRRFSKYWSTVRPQEEGQEIGTQLGSAFQDALEEFKSVNSTLPSRILVYRDGVSENQRQAVQTLEVSSFLKVINSLSDKKAIAQKPDLIIICANKRVNAKFFNGEHFSNPKISLGNPNPGTIIDTVVTNKSDFYLISQSARQGSVVPTHYFVLGYYQEIAGEYRHREDEIAKKINDIQLLTYKLCYLYYNWTGPVKIPAPIHYAHKLAKFVGEHLQGNESILPHARFGKLKSLYFI